VAVGGERLAAAPAEAHSPAGGPTVPVWQLGDRQGGRVALPAVLQSGSDHGVNIRGHKGLALGVNGARILGSGANNGLLRQSPDPSIHAPLTLGWESGIGTTGQYRRLRGIGQADRHGCGGAMEPDDGRRDHRPGPRVRPAVRTGTGSDARDGPAGRRGSAPSRHRPAITRLSFPP